MLKREKEKPLNILLQIVLPPGAQGTDFITNVVILSPTPKATICSFGHVSLTFAPICPALAYSSPLLPLLRKAFLIFILKFISSGNAD